MFTVIRLMGDVGIGHKRQAFLDAAGNGHGDVVASLIAGGINIDGYAAKVGFFHAVRNNDNDVVITMVNLGMDVDVFYSTLSQQTPLMHAAHHGAFNVAEYLIHAGAEVNIAEDDSRKSALHFAAGREYLGIMKLLIDKGANVDERDRGETILAHIVQTNHINAVHTLINAGADVNAKHDSHGITVLMRAAGHGNIDIVNALIHAGADVNATTSFGNTALTYAEREGYHAVAQILKDLMDATTTQQ